MDHPPYSLNAWTFFFLKKLGTRTKLCEHYRLQALLLGAQIQGLICSLYWLNIFSLFFRGNTIQSSLTYPDPTYQDYSLIRTSVWEPFMIIYVEYVSLIRIFSYPDSQLENGGVRISEAVNTLTLGGTKYAIHGYLNLQFTHVTR